MRILSISLRNLNSLAGDWSIDLNDPAYAGNGLFAITGPTGAGKSTILDAICLALYGRTPRLGKVSKSSNEIMSRQTGDCMAEVVFENTAGQYRCCWRQKKARNRPSGRLQEPQHQLFDSQGICIANGMHQVALEIERLTGMNFDRFTQSMVLAQGRFAAFLLSPGDKRAPLLEQITGTEIYAEISRRVFQRNKEEQSVLQTLRTSLEQLNLLLPEEEAGLRELLRHIDEDKETVSARKNAVDEDLMHHRRLETLEKELEDLCEQKKAWQTSMTNFAPDAARLQAALRTLPLSGALASLQVKRTSQLQDERAAKEIENSLPDLKNAADRAGALHERSVLEMEQAKKTHALLLKEWEAMRELDRELLQKKQEQNACSARMQEAHQAFAQVQKNMQQHIKEREDCQNALCLLMQEKEACSEDASLSDSLAGMQEQHRQILLQEQQRAARERQLSTLSLSLDAQEKKVQELHAEVQSCRTQETMVREQQKTLADSLDHILGGRNLTEWHQEKENCLNTSATFKEAINLLQHYHTLQGEQKNGEETAQKLAAKLTTQKQTLASLQGDLSLLVRTLDVEREALRLVERSLDFEKERQKLLEGSPCPLCGATSHPYAGRALPRPDENKERIRQLEEKQHALTQDILHGEKALSSLEKDEEHNARSLELIASDLLKTAQGLQSVLRQLSPALSEELTKSSMAALVPGAPENTTELSRMLEHAGEKNDIRLAYVDGILEQAEAQDRSLQDLHQAWNKAREQRESSEQVLHQMEQELIQNRTRRDTLNQEQKNALSQLEALTAPLTAALFSYGLETEDSDDRSHALNILAGRRDHYINLLEAEKKLREDLAEKEKSYALDKERLESSTLHLENMQRQHADSNAAYSQLMTQRQERFGDRDAAQEEERMNTRLEEGEKQEKHSREVMLQARRAHEKAFDSWTELCKRIETRTPALMQEEKAFLQVLSDAGFADEQAYQAALLPEQERQELEKRQRLLEEQGSRLDTLCAEKKAQWTEQQQRTSASSRQDLEATQEELASQLETILEQRGVLIQKLQHDAEQRSHARTLQEKTAAQEKICSLWNSLNELIGSAEGSKFRKYAQGLTFKNLIVHANRQLAMLTDRYVLVPNKTDALELDVIDRYQADAIRSSRNLSGGESFIVSLSLALGLAQMASRTVRVDSVFLDEGFGTLDEEALNTALAMLSSLRQRGKIIGLISHIQGLKDRIDTRIQVLPLNNGCSRLVGPGISGPATRQS